MIVPKLGKKNQIKMTERKIAINNPAVKMPQDRSLKICSTMECPRCHAPQRYWRATCFRCGACFYCGLVGGRTFQCHICGNHIPKEDREPLAERSIKIV